MSHTNEVTYGEYISAISQEHRRLSGLCEVLGQKQPVAKPRITLLDYYNTDRRTPIQSEPDGYQNITILPQNCYGRIILTEDIHGPMIENLGTELDIDPLFFACHISSRLEGQLDQLFASPREHVPSQSMRKGYLHLHYQRVLDLGPCSDLENDESYQIYLETVTNIARKGRILPYPYAKRQLAIVRGCCSMIVMAQSADSWICLVLIDPAVSIVKMLERDSSISVIFPCKEMQRQFTTGEIPKYSHFAANGLQSNQRQESTRERIKHAFLSAKGEIWEVHRSPLKFGYYIIKSITVDWVGHIQLMFPYMRHFEYASQQAKSRLSETSLYEINKWRQDSFVSLSTFKYLRQFIVYWSSETSVSYEEDLSLLLKDVEDVSAQTQDLIRAFSESINFVTSLIQLFDVRQSVTEAINVRRVTYIALVFVPLSWAASIFSMAENYSPGGSQFWIYWVVALPLLIMVFILSNTLPVQVWDRIRVFMFIFKVTGI